MTMETRASFAIARPEELERTGAWTLVRRSVGCHSFGINQVEIAPGDAIPSHDERARDQEEVFLVLAGDAAIVIDGEEHAAPAGTFARVDPQHDRTVRNPGAEPVSLLIVSAPVTSGYEPMEWA
jgi:mannose-6-phosphate isomerase-like protein (cupin superfamily)